MGKGWARVGPTHSCELGWKEGAGCGLLSSVINKVVSRPGLGGRRNFFLLPPQAQAELWIWLGIAYSRVRRHSEPHVVTQPYTVGLWRVTWYLAWLPSSHPPTSLRPEARIMGLRR